MIAFIECRWLEGLRTATLFRYDMPAMTFEDVGDVGMWVSRTSVAPSGVEAITDLPGALAGRGVALRVLETLTPLKDIWSTSLHASGIRLRNARGWDEPAQPTPASANQSHG